MFFFVSSYPPRIPEINSRPDMKESYRILTQVNEIKKPIAAPCIAGQPRSLTRFGLPNTETTYSNVVFVIPSPPHLNLMSENGVPPEVFLFANLTSGPRVIGWILPHQDVESVNKNGMKTLHPTNGELKSGNLGYFVLESLTITT